MYLTFDQHLVIFLCGSWCKKFT